MEAPDEAIFANEGESFAPVRRDDGIAAGRTIMTRPLSICWFRQDLRLADNPALRAAALRGEVLPVFILDDGAAGEDRIGAAGCRDRGLQP